MCGTQCAQSSAFLLLISHTHTFSLSLSCLVSTSIFLKQFFFPFVYETQTNPLIDCFHSTRATHTHTHTRKTEDSHKRVWRHLFPCWPTFIFPSPSLSLVDFCDFSELERDSILSLQTVMCTSVSPWHGVRVDQPTFCLVLVTRHEESTTTTKVGLLYTRNDLWTCFGHIFCLPFGLCWAKMRVSFCLPSIDLRHLLLCFSFCVVYTRTYRTISLSLCATNQSTWLHLYDMRELKGQWRLIVSRAKTTIPTPTPSF